jgi:hypothetical protein
LYAFIQSIKGLKYEEAVDLLFVSKSIHKYIAGHFGTDRLDHLVKLVCIINDNLMVERRGDNHLVSVDFYSNSENCTQPGELMLGQTETTMYASDTVWDLRTFYTGPFLLDVGLIHGLFEEGICTAKVFAYPYILIKIKSEDSMEETILDPTFISDSWIALARLFVAIFGEHCKIITFVKNYPLDQIFFIPT